MVNIRSNGKPPHIFMGVPTHDYRVHTRFATSLMSIIGCGRWKVTFSCVSSGGLHKARNNLAWEFLTKSDADYYLSVDSDISFDPNAVSRLMSHDKDIVAAPYTHKKPEIEWSARAIEGILPDPKTGLQEMSAMGAGFCLIKRRVFEKMRDMADDPNIHPLRWAYEDWGEGRGEKKWDLWWEGCIKDPEFHYPQPTQMTEDFGFCYWAQRAGFKIYVDTTFHLTHWEGGRGYPEIKEIRRENSDLLPEKNGNPLKSPELVSA